MPLLSTAATPRRPSRALAASFAVHAVAVALLVWGSRPTFVKLASSAAGDLRARATLVYAPAPGVRAENALRHRSAVRTHALPRMRHIDHFVASSMAAAAKAGDTSVPRLGRRVEEAEAAARASRGAGLAMNGAASDHDVLPAYPVSGPEPAVKASELPSGVEGDVTVELAIDAQGAVRGAVLLKGVGHGIDETVVETLKTWRFHPATRDGVPIASLQDVSFHFGAPA